MLSSLVLRRLHRDPSSSDESVLLFWLVNFKLFIVQADIMVTH